MTTTTVVKQRRIKCRFCDYSIPPFASNAAGKPQHWSTRMSRHIELQHPDEAAIIEEELGCSE